MEEQTLSMIRTLLMVKGRAPRLDREIASILSMKDGLPRQRKVNRVAGKALGMGPWTDEEKLRIANLIDTSIDDAKNTEVRMRVTDEEREEIKEMAREAGMTMSDYIRDRLGLETVI